MEFTSQICTTKEQSEQLLALGLKIETADMAYEYNPKHLADTDIDKDWVIVAHSPCGTDIPAWSLHRLIEMLNYQVMYNGKKYEPVIAIDGMAYQDVCDDDPIVGWSGYLYTDVIDCIEWLITEGCFKKKYLGEE